MQLIFNSYESRERERERERESIYVRKELCRRKRERERERERKIELNRGNSVTITRSFVEGIYPHVNFTGTNTTKHRKR